MVIVRESPNAKQPSAPPHWPPRSPYEVQLLSPSGRKRIQQLQRDLSPSPISRKRLAPSSSQTMAASDSEEEDEETLQLKLQAIEARLKLKKLQASKAKSAGKVPDRSNSRARPHSPEPSKVDVQVPFSPVRKRQPTPEQKSPARVILGIDKGLRAQDISLKRAANSRDNTSRFTSNRNRTEPAAPAPKAKSFSERIAESRLSTREHQEKDERIQQSRSRGFGLAEAGDIFNIPRTDSRQTDSSGASSRDDMRPTSKRLQDDSLRRKELSSRTESRQTDSSRTSSRESRFPPSSRRTEDTGSRRGVGSSDALSRPPRASEKETSSFRNTAKLQDADSSNTTNPTTQPSNPDPPEATSKFESFSGLHLTKRTTEHTKLTRALHGKEVYTLPRLLKEVKSPNYDPPDCEMDYVVMGIICYKTTPHDHKNNPKAISASGEDTGSKPKFMVLRLTDLKWEIDLFLFDTGFDQFWKLTEGTVIAVLNPGIMPPRVRESGAFSLKVTSCEDTIIEIGTAQDMGFCTAVKADGKQCTQWIDKRKTEICEFHLSLQIDKARKGRMQFNTMTGFGNGSGAGKGRGRGKGGEDNLKKEGKYHDRYLHETMYIAPREFGLSTASLLDEKSAAQKAGIDAKEASRKRRLNLEKEAELAHKLGMIGNGAGSEYLAQHSRKLLSKSKNGPKELGPPRPEMAGESSVLSGGTEDRPDAKALGLLSNKAQTVSLSPVKGRKRGFNTSSAKSHEAMGWSGAFKRGVLERSRSPEIEKGQTTLKYQQRQASPRKSSMKPVLGSDEEAQESPRKKARLLLTGKGVRIPGRESFGGKTPGDIFLSDDDD